MATTTVVLMRHGQTAWNLEGRLRGRANVPLDETGVAQAEVAARYIGDNWTPDAVYCSPLMRARQTAEKVAEPFILHERVHPGFLDIDYGVWEGHTPEELREKRWDRALEAWYTRPQEAPIPGGETLHAVRLRAMGAIREVVERHADQTVVVVAHTVVNRVILLGCFDIGNERFWYLEQDLCALNLLEFDGRYFKLIRMNDTCHLRSMESA
jgi:probable phosphoglycerate mutase